MPYARAPAIYRVGIAGGRAELVASGFNAATAQYEDLVKSGFIDPTKVTRSALQNASSIGALMLTTEAMICEIPEKKSAAPGGPGGHGPDMDY